jgi:hypothetical protein
MLVGYPQLFGTGSGDLPPILVELPSLHQMFTVEGAQELILS